MTRSTSSQLKKIPVDLVADYFIWRSNNDGKSITNKKLQKLIYYSQAWSLVINDAPIFKDKIEAWVHGPAVRSVYLTYRKFGYDSIKKNVDDDVISKIKPEFRKLLDEIWRVYGKHDAQYLELLTHNEIPWREARDGCESSEASDNEISLATMKSFYSELLENQNANA